MPSRSKYFFTFSVKYFLYIKFFLSLSCTLNIRKMTMTVEIARAMIAMNKAHFEAMGEWPDDETGFEVKAEIGSDLKVWIMFECDEKAAPRCHSSSPYSDDAVIEKIELQGINATDCGIQKLAKELIIETESAIHQTNEIHY
jgi:hypothetical protein